MTAGTCFILTNYRRQWNIKHQIQSCKRADPKARIIILDNSGNDLLRPLIAEELSALVRVQNFGRNMGAGYRFMHSGSLSAGVIVVLDDDLFMTPGQFNRLIDCVRREPDRMHGIFGEIVHRIGSQIKFESAIIRQNRDVDILNRLYGFTPAYARQAIEFAASLGIADWTAMGPIDDVVMSLAGAMRPRLHDFGTFGECHTSNTDGIATWRAGGFFDARVALLERVYGTGATLAG